MASATTPISAMRFLILLLLSFQLNAATISSGGAGITTIQDEGVGLTARSILNFTGSDVACVDNAGASRTDCTVTAAATPANLYVAGATYTGDGVFNGEGDGGGLVATVNSGSWATDVACKFTGGAKACINATAAGADVTIADNDIYDPNNADWSVSIWYNTSSFTGDPTLIHNRNGANEGFTLQYITANNRWQATLEEVTSGDYCQAWAATTTTSVWKHLVFTYDNAGTCKLYLDNVNTGTNDLVSTPAAIDSTNSIDWTMSNDNTVFTYDDMAVFNKVLSPTDVSNIWNSGTGTECTGSDASLVSCFPFDEGSGTTANDLKEAGNRYSATGMKLGDHYLKLEGVAGYATLPRGVYNANSGSFTTWVKTDGGWVSGDVLIASNDSDGAGDEFKLYYDGTVFRYQYDTASTLSCGTPSAAGTWDHLAITWNLVATTLTVKCYFNGNTETASATRTNAIGMPDDKIYIGWDRSTQYTDIGIDDTRFYDVALDTTAIGVIYNSGTGLQCVGNETDMVACYQLDNDDGTFVGQDVIAFDKYDGALLIDSHTGGASDANACTSSGSPCATFNGALAKFSKTFSQDLTIHVSSGVHLDSNIYIHNVRPESDGYLNIKGYFNPVKNSFTDSPLFSGTSSGSNTDDFPTQRGGDFNDTTSSPFSADLTWSDGYYLEITANTGFCNGTTDGTAAGLGDFGNWHIITERISDSQVHVLTQWSCNDLLGSATTVVIPDNTTTYNVYSPHDMSSFYGYGDEQYYMRIFESSGLTLTNLRFRRADYAAMWPRNSSFDYITRVVIDKTRTIGMTIENSTLSNYITNSIFSYANWRAVRIQGGSNVYQFTKNYSHNNGHDGVTIWRTGMVEHFRQNFSFNNGGDGLLCEDLSRIFGFSHSRLENNTGSGVKANWISKCRKGTDITSTGNGSADSALNGSYIN